MALLVLLLLNIGRTTKATFQTWPAEDEVQFVWQQALTEAAAYLDASDNQSPVAIGGWTPDTMDPPTMELTLRRDDLALSYFDPTQSIMIPAAPAGKASRILHPSILPMDPYLEVLLTDWGVHPEQIESFTLYVVPHNTALTPSFATPAIFDSELTLLGYDQLSFGEMLTYWRVEAVAGGPRSFFLHVVNENGEIVAQVDGQGAPAIHWLPGDILILRHSLDMVPEGDMMSWRLGVYDPDTNRRLITGDGRDFVLLSVGSAG